MEVYIKKVRKSFKENQVLDLEDICFKKGEITALMGKNGSGKSTLLNIIAGIDLEYEGEILYSGQPLSKDMMKYITLVNQKPYIFKKSVYENIAYPLKIRGVEKNTIEQKVNDMMKMLGIYEIRDRRGNVLSGGEVQRVSLARGLIISPKVLLLDEFTSNIDDKFAYKMEQMVLDYHKEKQGCIIMVTHDRGQAERMSDRIVTLEGRR